MQRTRTAVSAVLLAGAATVATAGVASAHESHGHDDEQGDGGRTGLVSGVAQGVGGLVGGGVQTVGNLLGADLGGPLIDGIL